MKREDYLIVIPMPGHDPTIMTRLPTKKWPAGSSQKRLSLPTAERHLQIVRRWLREGLIDQRKAKAFDEGHSPRRCSYEIGTRIFTSRDFVRSKQ
jgi:hypothetical protein